MWPKARSSFPRKRESILTLNGQIDFRFRGNGSVWISEASPEAAWILALALGHAVQARDATSKAGYAWPEATPSWLTQSEMSSRAKRGDLAFQPTSKCEIASSRLRLAMTNKFRITIANLEK